MRLGGAIGVALAILVLGWALARLLPVGATSDQAHCVMLDGTQMANSCDTALNIAICERAAWVHADTTCYLSMGLGPNDTGVIYDLPSNRPLEVRACRVPLVPVRAALEDTQGAYETTCVKP